MSTSSDFLKHLCQKYPGLRLEDQNILQSLISENLICASNIQLPLKVRDQAQEIIKTLFEMAHQKKYIDFYNSEIHNRGLRNPGNYGLMMSYDFHLDSEMNLKLIEVNTNASFLVLGSELYEMKNLSPETNYTNKSLKDCILQELKLNDQNFIPHRIAIIDDKPEQQRLFIEFLVAREVFRGFGFQTDILDSQSPLIKNYDFIYNRDTDFFLNEARTEFLRKQFIEKKSCFSPNPFEYLLMADKQRMIDWGHTDWQSQLKLSDKELEIIRKHVPKSYDFESLTAEEIWGTRKQFFFKPKRAFGAKQTFKGASISRKAFDLLPPQEFMGQEYIQAPEVVLNTADGDQTFKYDLRCYAYQGQLQLIMARVYQGQVTNLKTAHGGFACIQFQG